MRAKPHHYTKSDDDLIRRYYNSGEMTNTELAQRVGVSWGALKYHAACLGLSHANINRRWRHFTDYEDNFIIENAGNLSVSSIAQRLSRSPQAILDRMSKLQVKGGMTEREDWYTLDDASRILGASTTTVRELIRRGNLKAQTHWGKETAIFAGRECWHITREALREYIRSHPTALRNRQFDIVQVVEILAGVKA